METFFKEKKLIGVVYIPPTLGYQGFPGFEEFIDFTKRQVDLLASNGIHAALLENEHDRPYNVTATPECISSMTRLAYEIVNEFKGYPVGVEFLINDPKASLSIAKTAGANFIRTDYFVDRMSRDEYGGEMYINPNELIVYRNKIKANDIHIFADIQVKYAKMLEEKNIETSAQQAYDYHASAAVVSGSETGIGPNLEDLKKAKSIKSDLPIYVGSGLNCDNLKEIFQYADGAIVGSSLMNSGVIEKHKVQQLVKSFNQL